MKRLALFLLLFSLATGFDIKPQQEKAGSIQFNLNKVPVAQLGKEGYTLISSPDTDQISRYKYNTFHWHLTDDNGWRIEINSLLKLT